MISVCLVILTLTDVNPLQAFPLCPQPVGVIVSLPWSTSALINIADQLDQHPTVLSTDINLQLSLISAATTAVSVNKSTMALGIKIHPEQLMFSHIQS